jgi:pimeloyl-ACP methyl ester carboxylesterase
MNSRFGLILVFILALVCLAAVPVQAATTTIAGTFADGAKYLIEVPSPWNGTLLLYSHGYVTPGSANPAQDVGDPGTRAFLLANGFALAGSSYATTGWAIHEALVDQIAVLDLFNAQVGKPTRTIAWGHSLGGIITAGLIQRNPKRFDAALPMCGVLSGGVATWNQALDSAFAFKTFFNSGGPLQVVHITNPTGNFLLAEQLLAAANATPQGRARLALANSFGDLPGWFNPASPEPAANDFASQAANQFLWAQQVDFPFIFAFRAELEFRAGGNPSWNTGVNYREQFAHSVNQAEVRALYKQAGLDLHTEGDGLVSNQNESAYRDVVREAGNERLLRQIFVHRAGHCTFTPAETITALENLIGRLDTGHWPNLHADTLNAEAATLGPLNVAPPSFFLFHPAQFLRPFDAFDAARCARKHGDNDNDGVPCNAF